MWGNGDDGDLPRIRAIAPEDPVGGRRVLLHVGLENFLLRIVGVFQGMKEVGLKRGVVGIGLQETQRFLDLLDQPGMGGGTPEMLQFFVSPPGEDQFKHLVSTLDVPGEILLGLDEAAPLGLFQALLDQGGCPLVLKEPDFMSRE